MDSKRIEWRLESWPLEKLNPHPKNPRIITESKLKELENSFDDIGNAQPININIDGTILSGHARYYQLKKEGTLETAVYLPDRKLTPKQEDAVIIRMNKNIAGVWDFDILANEFDIDDLIEYGFDKTDFDINDDISPDTDGLEKSLDERSFFKLLMDEIERIVKSGLDSDKKEIDVRLIVEGHILTVLKKIDWNDIE